MGHGRLPERAERPLIRVLLFKRPRRAQPRRNQTRISYARMQHRTQHRPPQPQLILFLGFFSFTNYSVVLILDTPTTTYQLEAHYDRNHFHKTIP